MSAKFNKTSYTCTPYIVHQRKSNNNFASSKNTRLFLWVYRNQITHMLFYPLQENKKNTRHELSVKTPTSIIPSSFVPSVGRSVHSALAIQMFIWMFSEAICTDRVPGPASCSLKKFCTFMYRKGKLLTSYYC